MVSSTGSFLWLRSSSLDGEGAKEGVSVCVGGVGRGRGEGGGKS